MRHRNFYLKVADALAGCQLVELELKRYIATAHSAIRRNLPAHIAYRISDNDCARDALGQLIIKFEKLSNDDELIENLKKFNKKRNKLAHRAIASCINPDGDLDTPPQTSYLKLWTWTSGSLRLESTQIHSVIKYLQLAYFLILTPCLARTKNSF